MGQGASGRRLRSRAALVLAALLLLPLPVVFAAAPAAAENLVGIGITPAERIEVGQSGEVEAGYFNTGTAATLAPTISVSVSAELRIDSADCPISGQGVVCRAPPFPQPGSVVEPGQGITVSVEVTAVAPGNDAHLFISASSVLENLSASATVDVVDTAITADLHPAVATVDQGIVGEQFAFEGEIVNSGSTAFAAVTTTFEVGAELQVDAATWGAGNPCTIAGATVTCALGAVEAYSDVPVEVMVTPITAGDSVTTVSVSSSQPEDDPDPFPNVQQLAVPVIDPVVDLGLTLHHFAPTPLGEQEIVQALVSNAGPALARSTELSMTVPETFTITGTSTGCVTDGQTVSCVVGDLAAGSDAFFNVGLLPTELGTGVVQGAVTSATPEVDPDPAPNAATRVLTVEPPSADIEIDDFFGAAQTVVGEP